MSELEKAIENSNRIANDFQKLLSEQMQNYRDLMDAASGSIKGEQAGELESLRATLDGAIERAKNGDETANLDIEKLKKKYKIK